MANHSFTIELDDSHVRRAIRYHDRNAADLGPAGEWFALIVKQITAQAQQMGLN